MGLAWEVKISFTGTKPRNMYSECEPQLCTTVITHRTGEKQWTLGCSREGHQSRNKTCRNRICIDEAELFLALQLVRNWSSHQPTNWDVHTASDNTVDGNLQFSNGGGLQP